MPGYEKVFGIGLNKTGTTSLKHAFVALGFNHMDRQAKLLKLWRQGQVSKILQATDNYDSFEDWPWPLIARDLLDHYGENARFVLTRRRSAQVWVESLKTHAERTNPDQNPRKAIFGHSYPHGLESYFCAFYDRHLAAMRALFADRPHQMIELCWEEGDGWTQLCPFLGQPIPRKAFPKANRARDAKPNAAFAAENQSRIAQQLDRVLSP